MPRPFPIFSQSDYLIQVVDINSNTEWQTVQIQISWLLQKPTDLDLHCLQMQGISGFSRTEVKVKCGKYFPHCKLLKTLHIFGLIFRFTIFKIKVIRHHAESFTIWSWVTPFSTLFPKICANNSVSGLYDTNSILLTFNFILLSRTIKGMILIHICCSFVKMEQESAMSIFVASAVWLHWSVIITRQLS